MPTLHMERQEVEESAAPSEEPVPASEQPTLAIRRLTPVTPGGTFRPVAPSPSLLPGGVVLGRYRVEAPLGTGGTSLVFRVTDLRTDRPLAMKAFSVPEANGALVARFRQEFRFARELEHPNIVRLLDVGADGGLHFLLMEALDGVSLKTRLGQPLPPNEALRLLTHAAAALEYAHGKGIIHRDVKPGNFFLTARQQLKLLDFGLATLTANRQAGEAGLLLGTPEYISPEQVTGEHPATPATDLYSLGVVAYEMFTGAVPFRHPQLLPLLQMHALEPPPPPRELNPAIPEPIERVILKLLEKNPADRFASAAELRRALLRLWPVVRRG